MEFYSHQLDAVEHMKNGCILCGDVGTGKSRTALLYFYTQVCGGNVEANGEGYWGEPTTPRDIYIITTAKKRDTLEWIDECIPFALSPDRDYSIGYIQVTVDSWNNIKKYVNVKDAFFIFDEQRVSGWGAWSKTFLKITSKNQWILLSATPGDKWTDYIPVFIANGFYKSKSDFERQHCIFSPYLDFPKIERYINEGILKRHQKDILVEMKYEKFTIPHHYNLFFPYDKELYRTVQKDRWDPYKNEPIENSAQYCYLLRRVANSDITRLQRVQDLAFVHERIIIFYNYEYELNLLKMAISSMKDENDRWYFAIGEWNGHRHDPIPKPIHNRWVYLVQYNAGAEGWNCIDTDAIIFYSQNYSYRMTKQAAGRIDRLNTSYTDLHYYHFMSKSSIDMAIYKALKQKKNFNENAFGGKF